MGSEEFNFPFRFATKTLPSSVLGEPNIRDIDTEKTLKLLGFPDKEVHGWKIMPLRKPPVVSDSVCACVYICECVIGIKCEYKLARILLLSYFQLNLCRLIGKMLMISVSHGVLMIPLIFQ